MCMVTFCQNVALKKNVSDIACDNLTNIAMFCDMQPTIKQNVTTNIFVPTFLAILVYMSILHYDI